jgi:hypothetical protein
MVQMVLPVLTIIRCFSFFLENTCMQAYLNVFVHLFGNTLKYLKHLMIVCLVFFVVTPRGNAKPSCEQ